MQDEKMTARRRRFEQLAEESLRTLPYTANLKLHLLSLSPGEASAEMPVGPAVMNTQNIVHGGALYSLCDTVASLAAASNGGGGVTVQSSMQYLRPSTGPMLTCHARVVKFGRQMIWTDAEVYDAQGKLTCRASFIHHHIEGEINFGLDPDLE